MAHYKGDMAFANGEEHDFWNRAVTESLKQELPSALAC
jgi:hypothetical protein